MNEFLRNKWVVGLLALAAVAVLAMQFWPKHSRPDVVATGTSSPKTVAPATAAPNPTGRAAPPPATNAVVAADVPERSADRDFLTERFEVWRNMVGRDPFERPAVASTNTAPEIEYATNRLSLTTLWLQTGSRLAVVNGAILAEGDDILDYTVESIGFDHIYVFGQRGREHVPFGQRVLRSTGASVTGRSNPGRSPASPTRP